MHPIVRYSLPLVLTLLGTDARAAAPPGRLSAEEDVRRFYALPPGASVRLGELDFRHGGWAASAFSHDGRTYFSGGAPNNQGEIRVWNLATRRLVRRVPLPPCRSSLTKLLALPDGNLVVLAGEGFVLLVDPHRGKILRTIRPEGKENSFYGLAVSPDGKTLAIGDQRGMIHLQDVATGKTIAFPGSHSLSKANVIFGWVKHLAFSPDGKRLLSDGNYDHRRLWDVKNGKEIASYPQETITGGEAVFSPDGKFLAASRPRDADAVRNGPYHTALFRLDPFAEAVRLEQPEYAADLAFTSDGKTLVMGGFTVGAWDTKTGKRKFTTRLPGTYGQLSLSRDEKWIVYQGRWFDAATGKEQLIESGHMGAIWCLDLHNDLAATGADDGTVRVWDAATGKQLWYRTLAEDVPTPGSLAFSPNGDELAVLDLNNDLRILDARTGKERLRLPGVTGQRTIVRWSPDGKWLAAGGGSYTLFVFDRKQGKLAQQLVGYDGSMNTHWTFEFTRDSKAIIAPTQYNASDRVDKTGFGRQPKPIGPDDYNPKLGPPNDPNDRDAHFAVWDLATGKRVRLVGKASNEFALSRDGKVLAALRDTHVHIHDVASGRQLKKFPAAWGRLSAIRGLSVFVGNRMVDVETEQIIREWPVLPWFVAVSPDGKRMLTAEGSDSTALVWKMP